MPASGLVFLNDRDLYTDFSCVLTGLTGFPGQLGAAPRDVVLSDGPEMQGAILDPRLLRRKPGTASISGYIKTTTPALALTALDALKGIVGLGEIALRTIYAPDRYCLAVCESVEGSAYQPEIVNGDVGVKLNFTVKDGVAWRSQPDGIALSTARAACPIGTAESWPVILVHGGGAALTNPVVTVRNAAGDIVQTMTFTVSLGATAALRIDSSRSAVSLVTAGVPTDALAAGYWPVNSGDFPVLRPYDGNPELAAYPTMELSSSSGAAQGVVSYQRRYT